MTSNPFKDEWELNDYLQRARAWRSNPGTNAIITAPPAGTSPELRKVNSMIGKLKEKDVTRQIRDALKVAGYRNWKIFQTLGSYRGMSDIIAVQPGTGKFVAIEVKTPGWKPPRQGAKARKHYDEQAQFLAEVINAGGIGMFATCVDEVISRLELKLGPLFG